MLDKGQSVVQRHNIHFPVSVFEGVSNLFYYSLISLVFGVSKDTAYRKDAWQIEGGAFTVFHPSNNNNIIIIMTIFNDRLVKHFTTKTSGYILSCEPQGILRDLRGNIGSCQQLQKMDQFFFLYKVLYVYQNLQSMYAKLIYMQQAYCQIMINLLVFPLLFAFLFQKTSLDVFHINFSVCKRST